MAPKRLRHEARVELRVPEDDLKAWRRAADRRRVSLSLFIRMCVNANAGVVDPP
jgi:uncharacterized protein (DUF1778 family)